MRFYVVTPNCEIKEMKGPTSLMEADAKARRVFGPGAVVFVRGDPPKPTNHCDHSTGFEVELESDRLKD